MISDVYSLDTFVLFVRSVVWLDFLYEMKVLVSILGVQKAMVGDVFLSFFVLWATLGAQWRPKATKIDQRASKRRQKSAQRAPKATNVEHKYV